MRSPQIEDNTFKSYLSRLAINLETYAISTASNIEPSEANLPPAKELIYSETIKDSYEPIILSPKEGANPHIYVIWKVDVFICRPRGRLQKPAIYFAPAASLKPPERVKKAVLADEYLPSKVPTALNLLQQFDSDPALAGTHPRLSALRISRVAPTAPIAKELTRPVRNGLRRLFKAAPAVIWRIRYSRWQSSLKDIGLIASLNVEIAHVTSCSVAIQEVELSLQGGRVEPYTNSLGSGDSLVCKPGDQLTFLYKLVPDLGIGISLNSPSAYPLDLRIVGEALASENCRPKISIEWRTSVDFSVGSNTSFGRVAQLLGRPSNQPVVPAGQRTKLPGPDSLPLHDELKLQEEVESDDISISFTISGPPQVKVGDMFQWDVFIVNRSDRARKLAILIIPKQRRTDLERHQAQPLISSAGGRREDKDDLLATAVLDDNIVYAKQKNAKLEPAELISLTTDVRIGHISPGACYTAELKFLALSAGVLSVDALRVVDLATQEATDISDLPSVVVLE